MVVMFYNSDFTAVLGFLDKVDSCFYLQLFSARVFVPQVNDEMISILDQVKPFNLVPSAEKSVRMSRVPLDGSSLERWRVPSQPVESFLQKLKSSPDQSSQSSQAQMGHKLMLSVRDSYISRAAATAPSPPAPSLPESSARRVSHLAWISSKGDFSSLQLLY